MILSIELSKEEAIDTLLDLEDSDFKTINLSIDVYRDTDASTICWDLEEQIEELKSELKESSKEREERYQELIKKPFHEILEIGEEKDLWKQTEKQKRLIQ